MDQQAYRRARDEQLNQAARLVGYVEKMIEHGSVAEHHVSGLKRILADFERAGQAAKAA